MIVSITPRWIMSLDSFAASLNVSAISLHSLRWPIHPFSSSDCSPALAALRPSRRHGTPVAAYEWASPPSVARGLVPRPHPTPITLFADRCPPVHLLCHPAVSRVPVRPPRRCQPCCVSARDGRGTRPRATDG